MLRDIRSLPERAFLVFNVLWSCSSSAFSPGYCSQGIYLFTWHHVDACEYIDTLTVLKLFPQEWLIKLWNVTIINIANMCQMVRWLQRRGHKFCLQKSRMLPGRIGILFFGSISIDCKCMVLSWVMPEILYRMALFHSDPFSKLGMSVEGFTILSNFRYPNKAHFLICRYFQSWFQARVQTLLLVFQSGNEATGSDFTIIWTLCTVSTSKPHGDAA